MRFESVPASTHACSSAASRVTRGTTLLTSGVVRNRTDCRFAHVSCKILPGSHWIAPVFGTVVFAYGRWVFIRGAVHELKARLPGMKEIPVDQLHDGDFVLVRPGARIPADGLVREGSSAVNESMITGESRPIGAGPERPTR